MTESIAIIVVVAVVAAWLVYRVLTKARRNNRVQSSEPHTHPKDTRRAVRQMMLTTPEIAAAHYSLDLLSGDDMVDLAVSWLDGGIATYSVTVLAGEVHPSMSTTAPLFKSALNELGIPIPSQVDAANTVLIWYLKCIVSGTVSPVDGMAAIENNIYYRFREEESEKHVGDSLGIEHMFTWYRELQDAADGSMLLYYTDLPRNKAVEKFTEHLKEEARKVLANMETQPIRSSLS